jgi:histidyl-tRNA synthetase
MPLDIAFVGFSIGVVRMDDALKDLGQRIVEAARLAVLLHQMQEQDAQEKTPASDLSGGGE